MSKIIFVLMYHRHKLFTKYIFENIVYINFTLRRSSRDVPTDTVGACVILWLPPPTPSARLSSYPSLIDSYVAFAFIRCGLPPALRNLLGGCVFVWEEEHKQYIQLAILKTKQIRNKTISW
jgi:hypothetical protein